MMKEFLTEFFGYNFLANQALAEQFKVYDYQLEARVIRLASHILNAQQVWLERIEGEIILPSAWEDYPVARFESRNLELHNRTLGVLERCELGGVTSYKNFAGKAFEKKTLDILVHLVNHSTYHRGQIALLMRQCEQEPIISDYVYLKD